MKLSDIFKSKQQYLEIIDTQRKAITQHIKDYKAITEIAVGYKNDLDSCRAEAQKQDGLAKRQSKLIDQLRRELERPIDSRRAVIDNG